MPTYNISLKTAAAVSREALPQCSDSFISMLNVATRCDINQPIETNNLTNFCLDARWACQPYISQAPWLCPTCADTLNHPMPLVVNCMLIR